VRHCRAIIGAATPIWIVSRFSDQRFGFAVMSAILGTLIALTAMGTGVVREKPLAAATMKPSVRHFLRGLRQTARKIRRSPWSSVYSV